MTIRLDQVDGPSGRSAQFAAGEEIVVNSWTLPLPREKRIEINGRDCEGTFGMRPRFENDLLLTFTDDGCAIEVLGSHPEDQRSCRHCQYSAKCANTSRPSVRFGQSAGV
ncbi:MAG: hypothetical protein M3N29_03220 [Chloroflexota bacterium]|nr:hypothetical protein [Chloroflexota bacterium]